MNGQSIKREVIIGKNIYSEKFIFGGLLFISCFKTFSTVKCEIHFSQIKQSKA